MCSIVRSKTYRHWKSSKQTLYCFPSHTFHYEVTQNKNSLVVRYLILKDPERLRKITLFYEFSSRTAERTSLRKLEYWYKKCYSSMYKNNNIGIAFPIYMSPLSVISILFEDKSRRSEVVYHVCAKALRSAYMIAKRVWGWQWGDESVVMHVLVMGMLYYMYNHRPQTLKFRSIFELILGDS